MAQQSAQMYRDLSGGEFYYYVSNGDYFYCQRTKRAVPRAQAAGRMVPYTPAATSADPRTIPGTQAQGRLVSIGPQLGTATASSFGSAPGRDSPYALQPGPQSDSRPMSNPASTLEPRMTAMTIDNTARGNPATFSRTTTSVSTNQQGDKFQTSTDRLSRVSTIVQTEPVERITDEALLRAGIRAHGRLHGTEGETEKLYPTFKKRSQPRNFFVRGKVFLVLWAEPTGENTTVITTQVTTDKQFGEPIHSKVRRFVVVREGDNYCTALPVLTYGRQGVAKARVNKSEHAIIYTGKVPPQPAANEQPVRGEAGMRPAAIRVDPDDITTKLEIMSRIHFGRVYTVAHNIKVASFGMVNRDSENALLYQFRDVWMSGVPSADFRRPTAASGAFPAGKEATQQASAAQQVTGIQSDPQYQALLRQLGSHTLVTKDPRYAAIVREHRPTSATQQIQRREQQDASAMAQNPQYQALRRELGSHAAVARDPRYQKILLDPQYLALRKELGDHAEVAKDPRYQQVLPSYHSAAVVPNQQPQQPRNFQQDPSIATDSRYMALLKELGSHEAVAKDPRYRTIVRSNQPVGRDQRALSGQQGREVRNEEEDDDEDDDDSTDDKIWNDVITRPYPHQSRGKEREREQDRMSTGDLLSHDDGDID